MVYFGADYYPEHWPEARWPEDALLMAAAGFNVVRLAEFAWARLEPSEGQFDFGWLDRAIDLLASHGMRVVLGTPTASPPPWIMEQHPDLYRVTPDGRRLTYGLRREYCPNHQGYHDHCRRIVDAMAAHYSGCPAVIGWQIDNEFGDRCYCPTCASAFQSWLREHYGSLDGLNERWGTVFWSHVYSNWEQIPVPLNTIGPSNPGLALDYFRFCSDSYVAFQQKQIDILRSHCPEHFITHNMMGFAYDQIDYFALARPLDLVSWDNYPRLQWNMHTESDPVLPALGHDTMRGLKRQPFWVMEQQAGPAGWDIVGPTPRPGELRLWAYQAIAHGADGIVFFRWRTAQVGTEQYWHGLLDHHGRPGRRYEEIRKMGAEIAALGKLLDKTSPESHVAILHSYDSRFAFQIQAQNPDFHYPSYIVEVYRTLYDLHIPVDIVSPEADLSSYRLVIAPALHVVGEQTAANLQRYAAAGGVLMITARSGVKDEANRVVDQTLPGLLAELCGVEVEEYDSLSAGKSNAIRFVGAVPSGETSMKAEAWCEVLRPLQADILGVYTQDFYAGRPAMTRRSVGSGTVVYIGTFGKQDLLRPVLRWLLQLTDVKPLISPSAPGLEVAERRQGERSLLFVLNHTDQEQWVRLEETYQELITGSRVAGTVPVASRDLLILEVQKASAS
jgi:beta-galactosidase